ncbi:MAG: hypothetical protein L7S64_03015 [Longimicrobiales bacterium]|nr:hypothetical protein [Longimicrobiales bacterium]
MLVEDANGNPAPGVIVSWGATGGSITNSSQSDPSGIAVATRVLGTIAGAQAATASVGGLVETFTATAVAGAATQIALQDGNDQSATVNTTVLTVPTVRVTDQYGNAVSTAAVTFSVTAGGGSVSPTGAIGTDSSGDASVTSWTLGTAAGTNNNTLSATTGTGLTGEPVVFTATATTGAPTQISVASGNNQTAVTGSMVNNQPTVTVTDAFGNVVTGATVNFSPDNGGAVGNTSVVTVGGSASTSWTVIVGSALLENDGTFPNVLTATVSGSGAFTTFEGTARYSYPTHVDPIWSGCLGCHGDGGLGGLTLSGDDIQNWTVLRNVSAQSCAGFVRISPVGGSSAENLSLLLRNAGFGFTEPALCNAHGVKMDTPDTDIVRAWVRNGAPSN